MAINEMVMCAYSFTSFINWVRGFSLLVLCILHFQAFAQINEDFSDPDLTSNPCWSGTLNDFEINAYQQLHLKTSGADTSYISTPLSCSAGMEWKFWVHLSFAPSENNNARIYLIADNTIPTQSDKAFYVQLGEARSLDAITLFYKNGATTREVCRGTAGLIANPFTIRIRVVRNSSGIWKIATDPTGANFFANEASGTEKGPLTTGFFSLFCRYTTSNSSGFYFDDIHIQSYTENTFPPLLLQASITGDNQIELNFNEPIEKTTSTQLSNYSLSDGTHPTAVYGDPLAGTNIFLDFNKPLPVNQPFALKIQSVTDLDGNTSPQNETSLFYHPIQSFDVLISEIMANPVPSRGLPECEYLELYNRTPYSISLNGWTIQTGKKEQPLPDSVIASHQYLIISAASDALAMKKYGKTIAVNNLTLANDGCLIVLKDRNRQVIHALDFKSDWYDDNTKKGGGWSLEMIDPLNPCGEAANYRSSIDARGGTPGSVNSVNASFPDHSFPQLLSVFPTDSIHLRVDFSETLDTLQMSDPTAYAVEPSIGQPKSIFAYSPIYQSVCLELAHPLLKKTVYTLTVNNNMNDCVGNKLKIPATVQFGLPLPLKQKGIAINEIMFDPGPDKQEFIEIYNRSSETYDLSRLYLKVENSTSSVQKPLIRICEEGQLISPGEYRVLTDDKKLFSKQYPLLSPALITEVSGFPALSNEGGVVTLTDSAGTMIDKAGFDPSMHFQMLRLTTGVSLERIDPDGASDSKANWQSASETSGFSTPGRINSQHVSQNPSPLTLTLEPDQFTPDNDGIDDNLIIKYHPDKPGCMMTILIFDIKGRQVRQLGSNILLGTENTFTWDGLTDNHTKASPGIYIVYAAVYNPTGKVTHFKKTTILASQLKR
jgi:hypothetical protein